MELLVAISVVMVLAGLTMQVMKNGRQKAQQVRAAQKIKDLGAAFVAYTGENGGLLPGKITLDQGILGRLRRRRRQLRSGIMRSL
jgi:type II secretory pathway pseudopilin PulG